MNERLTRWRPLDRWGDEAAYFLAFNVANVLNYAYLVLMGVLLGTESYGLFGALFGLVYLVSALGNTVQMAIARHVAYWQPPRGEVTWRSVVAMSWLPGLVAITLGLLFVAVSPVLAGALHSPTQPLLWTGLAIALSVVVPAAYGVLQGSQHFSRLGLSLLVAAVARIAVGGALVVAGGGTSAALLGVALGYAASGLVFLMPVSGRAKAPAWEVPALSLWSMGAFLVASVAVAVPTSMDVVLVKHFFPAREAGMYAAVAVLGRVVLFMPLAVSFILLPKVARRVSEGRDGTHLFWWGAGLTGALSAGAAVVIAAASGFGLSPVGSDISGAVQALHWYLPAMVAFALVVAAAYNQLGRGNSGYVFAVLVPGVVAQAALIILVHGSLTAVAQMMFAVNGLLLGGSLLHAALPVARRPLLRLWGRASPWRLRRLASEGR